MIVLYRGSRGAGKTLSMVKDAYKFYLAGYRIVANLSLSFGESIENVDVLKLDRNSDLKNCVLVLDEIQLFFDSRNFGKKENKDFSNFIQQIRKRNIIILCTTQYQNTIDLRLRQHIDVLAFPRYHETVYWCSVQYFDILQSEDLDFRGFRPTVVSFPAKQVFALYNTYEMLK